MLSAGGFFAGLKVLVNGDFCQSLPAFLGFKLFDDIRQYFVQNLQKLLLKPFYWGDVLAFQPRYLISEGEPTAITEQSRGVGFQGSRLTISIRDSSNCRPSSPAE